MFIDNGFLFIKKYWWKANQVTVTYILVFKCDPGIRNKLFEIDLFHDENLSSSIIYTRNWRGSISNSQEIHSTFYPENVWCGAQPIRKSSNCFETAFFLTINMEDASRLFFSSKKYHSNLIATIELATGFYFGIANEGHTVFCSFTVRLFIDVVPL